MYNVFFFFCSLTSPQVGPFFPPSLRAERGLLKRERASYFHLSLRMCSRSHWGPPKSMKMKLKGISMVLVGQPSAVSSPCSLWFEREKGKGRGDEKREREKLSLPRQLFSTALVLLASIIESTGHFSYTNVNFRRC